MSTAELEKDFATPDRTGPQSASIAASQIKNERALESSVPKNSKLEKVATVTPPESMTRDELMKSKKKDAETGSALNMVTSQVDSPDDRHVRFNNDQKKHDPAAESPSSNSSQRGLVSRRGGKCASPSRSPKGSSSDAVLEFKTYRSPPRKKREEIDTVPSLCSDKDKIKAEARDSSSETKNDRKPSSISCDASMNQTSPLASEEAKPVVGKEESKTAGRKNNVTFSPVPNSKENVEDKVSLSSFLGSAQKYIAHVRPQPVKTPTRSPTGKFQSLPHLDDAALASPGGGLFLSPHPSSGEAAVPARSPKTPRSPRTPKRESDRDRFLATPTDFATDYGKHPNSATFDSSNGMFGCVCTF